MLKDLSLDLAVFAKELKQFPLPKAGRDQESLLALFEKKYTPADMDNLFCIQCTREVYCVYSVDERWWEQLLRGMKHSTVDTGSNDSMSETFSAKSHLDSEASMAAEVNQSGNPESVEDFEDSLLCWKCGIMREVRGSGHLKSRVDDDEPGK